MDTGLKCPKCHGPITRGEPQCAQCGAVLKWRNPVQKAEPKPETPPAAVPAEAPAFCTQCGGKLEPGQRFCPGCGVPVAASRAATGTPGKIVLGRAEGQMLKRAGEVSAMIQMHREDERQAARRKEMWNAVVPAGIFGFAICGFIVRYFPEVLVFLGLFIAAMCVSGSKRRAARPLLASREFAKAKELMDSASKWQTIAIVACVGAIFYAIIRFGLR